MGWVGLGHKNGPMDNCDPTCDGRTRRLPVIMMCYPLFVPAVWWRNKQVIAPGAARRYAPRRWQFDSGKNRGGSTFRSGRNSPFYSGVTHLPAAFTLGLDGDFVHILQKFVLIFLPPALARKVMRSVVSVRLFVFTVTFEPPGL